MQASGKVKQRHLLGGQFDAIWGEGEAQWYKNVLGMHKTLALSSPTAGTSTSATEEFGILCPIANGDPV